MTDTARDNLNQAQAHTIEAFDALRRAEKADTDPKMVQEVSKAVVLFNAAVDIMHDVVNSVGKQPSDPKPPEPVSSNPFKIKWGNDGPLA